MKYISLIDLLGLNLDDISNLDTNGIIRLQKQLKAKAMLENTSNIGELSKFIDELKNENKRQCYLFVEKHSWLKQLISGNHKSISQKDIDINSLLIHDLESLKYFLDKYLKENLKVFLSDSLSKGKYEHILKILKHNYLFTEETNQLVINFFRARLNFATTYIREGKLKDKQSLVAFISNKTFIKCLNVYPDSYNEEIQELNSEIIDIYNFNRKRTENQDFKFVARVMVALSILDTSNIFLKDNLKENAKIAREYTLPSSRQRERSSSSWGGWSGILGVFLVIRIIFWIVKGVSSSTTPDYPTFDFENYRSTSGSNNPSLKSIDSIINEMRKGNADTEDLNKVISESSEFSSKNSNKENNKYKLSNHIRFIYTMKRKVDRKTYTDLTASTLEPFTNPYPKTYNLIPFIENNKTDSSYVTINNKTKKDLIIFRLTQGIDQSIYIPENENISILLKAQDSVVFYSGKDFVETSFSHFKTKSDLSKMYKIEDYKTQNKEITIFPFKDKIRVINSKSKKRVVRDTSRIEKIIPNNLVLIPISIDAIYTDYYNKNYRN